MVRRGRVLPLPDSFQVPERKPFLEADIHVVTPMFGGSATPGEVDGEFPITAKTVRGHLRFWWRACRAHAFTDPKALFLKESELWGRAASRKENSGEDRYSNVPPPSSIEVSVHCLRVGDIDPPPDVTNDLWEDQDATHYPAYALFPFQRQRTGQRRAAQRGRSGVSFKLILSSAPHFSQDQQHVEDLKREASAAIWAWINFGGVGARTRRGCGALWCEEFSFLRGTKREWFAEKALLHAPGDVVGGRIKIPVVRDSSLFLHTVPMSHREAWTMAVNLLREFRQGAGIGRTGRRGTSLWPEADSVRNIWGKCNVRHQPADNSLCYFPRAEFGAPIIFHFKQDDLPRADGEDPPDHTVQIDAGVQDATRFASPIICKPLAISPTHSVPLIIWLNAPRLGDFERVRVRLNSKHKSTVLSIDPNIENEDAALLVPPLHQFNAWTALDAFFAYLKSTRGWAHHLIEVDI